MRGMLNLQIAIDGPAASGKGTIAKNVSKILGFHYLDTGLLYRGIAWLALNAQIDLDDVQNILPLVAQLEPNHLDNTLLSQHHIGSAASQIAIHPTVRSSLLTWQRDFAEQMPGAILDGRDIGTVVLPDAPIKIFVTAHLEVRAQRRYFDVSRTQPDIQFDDIMKDLAARDKRDQERAEAPLKPAHDAILLDTTSSSIDQSVDHVLDLVSRYREQTN